MNYKKSYQSKIGYTSICKIGKCSLKMLEFGIIELGNGDKVNFNTGERNSFYSAGRHCNVH